MKTFQQNRGIEGEDHAVKHLINKGLKIRERNWRCGHLEVDIIAENDDYVIFVEVKTRKGVVMGAPEDFVTRQKQKNIIRAASYYAKFKNERKEFRFDIVSVVIGAEGCAVWHIEDAFKPLW